MLEIGIDLQILALVYVLNQTLQTGVCNMQHTSYHNTQYRIVLLQKFNFVETFKYFSKTTNNNWVRKYLKAKRLAIWFMEQWFFLKL